MLLSMFDLGVWIILVISAKVVCIAENILPSLCVFFLLICFHIEVQRAQAVVHSPTNQLVGKSWWWAVAWGEDLLHWHSHGRIYMAPHPNIFINGYPPVISYGGVLLLGLPILLQEPCPQLVAFQWVSAAPNLALTVWAVSYWGQWESSS